jgi:DNA-binding FadR family transcriptional regulator
MASSNLVGAKPAYLANSLTQTPGRRVRNRLAEMIRSGEMKAGDRLPTERQLMEDFGVGRSIVREAITDLASQGLLKTRPGCRPIISRPNVVSALGSLSQHVNHLTMGTEAGIKSLFETRVFMEVGLVRWAALHARREDIAELKTALEKNREAIGISGDFETTDAAFHHVLYKIPRNEIYPAVHRAYVEWLFDHWRAIEATAELDTLYHAGHHSIMAAILERDPDAAEDALRRHLKVAWDKVRSTFSSAGHDSNALP